MPDRSCRRNGVSQRTLPVALRATVATRRPVGQTVVLWKPRSALETDHSCSQPPPSTDFQAISDDSGKLWSETTREPSGVWVIQVRLPPASRLSCATRLRER